MKTLLATAAIVLAATAGAMAGDNTDLGDVESALQRRFQASDFEYLGTNEVTRRRRIGRNVRPSGSLATGRRFGFGSLWPVAVSVGDSHQAEPYSATGERCPLRSSHSGSPAR